MSNIQDQLQKLEDRKADLIAKRQQQITEIISQAGALATDDKLIAGAMLFLSNPENKSHPILAEFTKLAKAARIRFPSSRRNKKTSS